MVQSEHILNLHTSHLELRPRTLQEACLSLLEVDDVPNGVEVLKKADISKRRQVANNTYINFNVQVLQVESVLPDVDTNDGDMAKERILVSSGHDLEALVRRVKSLSWIVSDDSSKNKVHARAIPIQNPGCRRSQR